MTMAAVVVGVLIPFPFYYLLWNYPQAWVDLCGTRVDPSHRMAQISHILKVVQFVSLLSVAHLSSPPWYCVLLFLVGQYLNFKVYQLLGETGTYYGVRFGKNIPWVTQFPFGYIKDPQYVGSILSLLACLCSIPLEYVFLWILGYLFMMWVESTEDPMIEGTNIQKLTSREEDSRDHQQGKQCADCAELYKVNQLLAIILQLRALSPIKKTYMHTHSVALFNPPTTLSCDSVASRSTMEAAPTSLIICASK